MLIKIGETTFDDISYDHDADVLYLSVGPPQPASDFDATPEGHAVRYNQNGDIIGISIVSAKALLIRDHEIKITIPQTRHISSDNIAPALVW